MPETTTFLYRGIIERLQVLLRYLFFVRCLTEYQNRLEFPLRRGEYDDVFIGNLIIIYNWLHFVDIVEVRGSSPPNPTIAKPPDCRVAFLPGFSRVCGLSYRCGTGSKAEGFAGQTPTFFDPFAGFGAFCHILACFMARLLAHAL